MKKIASFFVITLLIGLFACDSGSTKKSKTFENPNLKEVVVKEIVQTSSYTYLKFDEEGDEYWGAIPRREDIVKGNTYYFDGFMEMKNFPSKELNKTFESVYFIEAISDQPIAKTQAEVKTQIQPQGKKGSPKTANMEIEEIEAAEGGITISELYANREKYAGKKVILRGVVVKFMAGVMEKNWVHIQDGTVHGANFDVTITTNDVVDLNDVATFEGIVFLDKDFGYGYKYEILIEDAKLLNVDHSKHM